MRFRQKHTLLIHTCYVLGFFFRYTVSDKGRKLNRVAEKKIGEAGTSANNATTGTGSNIEKLQQPPKKLFLEGNWFP